MMRPSILAVAVALTLGFAPSANATLFEFDASLNQATEANHLNPVSPATGYVQVFLDTTAHTLTLNFTFQGLVGTTTDAHIHCCTTTPGLIGGAVVATRNPLGVAPFLGIQAGTFSVPLNTTLASEWNGGFLNLAANGGNPLTAENTLLAGMLAGQAYFNIHTTAVGSGEIAGFLVKVPEPSSIAIVGGALLAFAAANRRRKAKATSAA
jgi:hypothetical protein